MMFAARFVVLSSSFLQRDAYAAHMHSAVYAHAPVYVCPPQTVIVSKRLSASRCFLSSDAAYLTLYYWGIRVSPKLGHIRQEQCHKV